MRFTTIGSSNIKIRGFCILGVSKKKDNNLSKLKKMKSVKCSKLINFNHKGLFVSPAIYLGWHNIILWLIILHCNKRTPMEIVKPLHGTWLLHIIYIKHWYEIEQYFAFFLFVIPS